MRGKLCRGTYNSVRSGQYEDFHTLFSLFCSLPKEKRGGGGHLAIYRQKKGERGLANELHEEVAMHRTLGPPTRSMGLFVRFQSSGDSKSIHVPSFSKVPGGNTDDHTKLLEVGICHFPSYLQGTCNEGRSCRVSIVCKLSRLLPNCLVTASILCLAERTGIVLCLVCYYMKIPPRDTIRARHICIRTGPWRRPRASGSLRPVFWPRGLGQSSP